MRSADKEEDAERPHRTTTATPPCPFSGPQHLTAAWQVNKDYTHARPAVGRARLAADWHSEVVGSVISPAICVYLVES